MNIIKEDIKQSGNIILDGKTKKNYDVLYQYTNENLYQLFKDENFEGKNILTVLSSSDQLFNILKDNPNNVDTYDINRLTKYYYYLRKWNILYNRKYYLPDIITGLFIHELLDKVEPTSTSEEQAFIYWDKLTRIYPSFLIRYLFSSSARAYKDNFSNISIGEKLQEYDLSFENIDISSDIDINKKYDYIITSNISEYFNNDIEKLIKYRNNLLSLLNNNGKVISSSIMERTTSIEERQVFDEYFERNIHNYYKNPYLNMNFPVGYTYQKKMSTK